MCLAVPALVVAINPQQNMATVAVDQVWVEVSLALVDEVQVGDYLLIHVGFALQKIDQAEAAATLALFAEAGLMTGA